MNAGLIPASSACANGCSRRIQSLPARESASLGTSRTLAEPVRMNLPGVLRASIARFREVNISGTRCTSSSTTRSGRSATSQPDRSVPPNAAHRRQRLDNQNLPRSQPDGPVLSFRIARPVNENRLRIRQSLQYAGDGENVDTWHCRSWGYGTACIVQMHQYDRPVVGNGSSV